MGFTWQEIDIVVLTCLGMGDACSQRGLRVSTFCPRSAVSSLWNYTAFIP